VRPWRIPFNEARAFNNHQFSGCKAALYSAKAQKVVPMKGRLDKPGSAQAVVYTSAEMEIDWPQLHVGQTRKEENH
jgi:hypothetical protein